VRVRVRLLVKALVLALLIGYRYLHNVRGSWPIRKNKMGAAGKIGGCC
jgi:hypothetical protein